MYKEIYALRERVLAGQDLATDALLQEYEQRTTQLKDDEDFGKLEFQPIDVKDI